MPRSHVSSRVHLVSPHIPELASSVCWSRSQILRRLHNSRLFFDFARIFPLARPLPPLPVHPRLRLPQPASTGAMSESRFPPSRYQAARLPSSRQATHNYGKSTSSRHIGEHRASARAFASRHSHAVASACIQLTSSVYKRRENSSRRASTRVEPLLIMM